MQDILELNDQDWLTGITAEINKGDGPVLSDETNGVSATDLGDATQNNGILSVGPKPFEVKYRKSGDSTEYSIDDIWGSTFLKRSETTSQPEPTRYIYGETGNLFRFDATDVGDVITDLRNNDPYSDAAAGASSLTMTDGTQYVFYAREGHIGRYALSGDVFNDTWHNLSSSTQQRPMHRFQDRVYFGNENKVGVIFEESGSLSVNAAALDLPPSETIIDFAGLTKYLVIATDSGDVFFWNTNSDSWQRRHTTQLIFQGLYSVHSLSGGVYALLNNGIWKMSFSQPPSRVVPFSSNSSISPQHDALAYSTGFGSAFSDSNADKFAWVTENDGVAVFSAESETVDIVSAGLPAADPATPMLVNFTDKNIVAHVESNGLYKMEDSKFGGVSRQAQPGVTQAETRILDMQDTYQVKMIEVLLDEPPQTHTDYADDKLVVKARKSTNDSYITYGTIDTNNNDDEIQLYNNTNHLTDDTIQLKLEFEGGNPLVRSVGLYGDKVSK